MNNCFVKKLNLSVNDADLLKRGEFRFSGMNTSGAVGTFNISPVIGKSVECRVLGNNSIKFSANNERTITFGGNTNVNTTAEADIAITYDGLAKINNPGIAPINIDALKYCQSLVELVGRNMIGDLSSLSDTILENLTLSSSGVLFTKQVTGELSGLPTTLTTIWFDDASKCDFKVSDMARFASINYFVIRRATISGSISSLVFTSNSISQVRFDTCNLEGSISTFANANPQIKSIRLSNNQSLTGNVSELTANNNITEFEVYNTGFVGTAAQIKAKFPNASVTDASGGTA